MPAKLGRPPKAESDRLIAIGVSVDRETKEFLDHFSNWGERSEFIRHALLTAIREHRVEEKS